MANPFSQNSITESYITLLKLKQPIPLHKMQTNTENLETFPIAPKPS